MKNVYKQTKKKKKNVNKQTKKKKKKRQTVAQAQTLFASQSHNCDCEGSSPSN